MPSLLQRLKERKLFQWALAYLAGAWLIFQGIEVLAEPWNLSEAVQRSVHVLLGVGFFVTLILAWYHGEKGRQRASGVELLILAGILVIAGAAVAVLGRGRDATEERVADQADPLAQTIDAKSVAVLPFANLGNDPENEFFSDGMTGDIINHLVRVADLKVISRTSAMQYKNTDKNLRQIGQELGVATIVEGEVQRIDNRVRINAQLIDAKTDVHLWADQYDRQIEDIFDIQSEIAERIAGALQATLTPTEKSGIEQRFTDNLQAYEYYLRGENYYRTFVESSIRAAISMYEEAISLDPDFALAYARLSRAHGQMYWYYYDHSDNRLVQVKSAADRAIALEPGLPEAHEALGYYHYWGRLDYERATAEFGEALSSQPGNSGALAALAYVQRRQGQVSEAAANLKKALALDPHSARFNYNLGITLRLLREYSDAELYIARAISLTPEWANLYVSKARLYLLWSADTPKAREVLAQADAASVAEYEGLARERLYIDVLEGVYQQALGRIESMPWNVLESLYYFTPKALLYAQVYGLMGQTERELANYDSARAILETELEENTEDHRLHSSLGIAYAGLGRRDEAIREAKRGVELMPLERNAYDGRYRVEDLARVYVMVGEYDAAIDQLDYLLSIPGELSVPLLRIDPTWDPLRDHPRFQALLARYE